MSNEEDNDLTVSGSSTEESEKNFKTGGKQKGFKALFKMKNGKFKPEDIFLYVPRDSIPESDLNRFLQLCDLMIIDLGAPSVSYTDLEEISLIYRDSIFINKQFKLFSEASGALDTSMVKQVETLNKNLEQRKENLGSRFVDKGKKREANSTKTITDLIASFEDKSKELEQQAEALQKEISENKKEKFTSTAGYMANKVSSSTKLLEGQDE